MSKPAATPHAIPEERVAAILARAAELDRDRKETITVDAIRTAAVDAGISMSAVDAALAEYAAGEVFAPAAEEEPGAARARRFPRVRALLGRGFAALKTPLKLGAAFFVVGLAGAAGEGAVIAAWLAWLFVAGRLVLRYRRSRRAVPFVLGLVYMTFGLMLGFAATDAVDEDAIFALLPVGGLVLFLGSLAIKLRLPRQAPRAELEAPAR